MSSVEAPDDTLAAAELIDSLEEWFCQGAVTSRVGDVLSEAARDEAFANLLLDSHVLDSDSAEAHNRMGHFSRYSELVDYLLDHFVSQLAEGENARASLQQDIASIVVALVEDPAKQHFTCVPFIAGALDFDHFQQLVADTQSMLDLQPRCAEGNEPVDE